MNILTATASELQSLKDKGARWFCIAAYDHAGHQKGDILSWHKTIHSAHAAAKGEYRTIAELEPNLVEAHSYEKMMAPYHELVAQ